MIIEWLKNTTLLFFNEYGLLCVMVFLAIFFDVITGLLKGKLQRNINSSSALRGFIKKIGLLAALFFGFFLELVKIYILRQEELFGDSVFCELAKKLSFGHLIGFYIILNEGISIIENLSFLGVKMPKFIVNMLKNSKTDIDNKKL